MPIPKRLFLLDDPYFIPFAALTIDFLFTVGGEESFATIFRQIVKIRRGTDARVTVQAEE